MAQLASVDEHVAALWRENHDEVQPGVMDRLDVEHERASGEPAEDAEAPDRTTEPTIPPSTALVATTGLHLAGLAVLVEQGAELVGDLLAVPDV